MRSLSTTVGIDDAAIDSFLADLPDIIESDENESGDTDLLDLSKSLDKIEEEVEVAPKPTKSTAAKKPGAKKSAGKKAKKVEDEAPLPEAKIESASNLEVASEVAVTEEAETETAATEPEEEFSSEVVSALANEGKPAKQKKEKAPPRPTYVTHSKSSVLRHKLGDDISKFVLLEMADALLEGEEQKGRIDEVLASIDACSQKKVQEKAVMLFDWMKHGGAMNEVMKRAFEVLLKDGEITTGDKGNLTLNLLAKPYSVGTARAQAGQILTLFPLLKITTKEKGKMVANSDSLILEKAKAEFKL